MELHCHWPVQTTKMEERNGGFHAPAHRPVKRVCAFSQITLINHHAKFQNVLLNNSILTENSTLFCMTNSRIKLAPRRSATASHDSSTLGVPAGALLANYTINA